MIKKHLPVFLGRKVQQQQKETAHTWPGFWGAHVQKRFSNRHGSRCTAAHCCRPSTELHGAFLELGHGNLTPSGSICWPLRSPAGAQLPGQGAARPGRTAHPAPLPGWCPRRAPSARCPGSYTPCRSARRPPSPPGGTRSRWRRSRSWTAGGTAGAASCPSSARRSPAAPAAPGGCPAPPRSPRRWRWAGGWRAAEPRSGVGSPSSAGRAADGRRRRRRRRSEPRRGSRAPPRSAAWPGWAPGCCAAPREAPWRGRRRAPAEQRSRSGGRRRAWRSAAPPPAGKLLCGSVSLPRLPGARRRGASPAHPARAARSHPRRQPEAATVPADPAPGPWGRAEPARPPARRHRPAPPRRWGEERSNRIEPSRAAGTPARPFPPPPPSPSPPFWFRFPCGGPRAAAWGCPGARPSVPPYLRAAAPARRPSPAGRGSPGTAAAQRGEPRPPEGRRAVRPRSPALAGGGLGPSLGISASSGPRMAVRGPCVSIPSVPADTGGHLQASAAAVVGPRHPGVAQRAPRGRGCDWAVTSPRGLGGGAWVTARSRRLRALPRPRCGSPRPAAASPAAASGTGAWDGAGLPGSRNCLSVSALLLSSAQSGCLQPPVAAIPKPPWTNFSVWHPLPWYFLPANSHSSPKM